MSGRTQFWLGSLMLALALGLLVGGAFLARPSYGQAEGEGRSGNYAIVSSGLAGLRPKSRVVYVVDDRNEALFLFETVSSKTSRAELRDVIDLRSYGTQAQKKRAEKEKKEERKHPLR